MSVFDTSVGIFTIIGYLICMMVGFGVVAFVFREIVDFYRKRKSIPYHKSFNTKCFKCGSEYTISGRTMPKDVYDAFCPFCGKQNYLISKRIADNLKKKE